MPTMIQLCIIPAGDGAQFAQSRCSISGGILTGCFITKTLKDSTKSVQL